MPSTDATKALSDQIRARDWNRVRAPCLFGEKGLADLQKLLGEYGHAAVDEAVRQLLARSKVDHNIVRNYVRSWKYFAPLCEQIAMEKVS
jgi:hypothetical protein